MNLSRKLIIPFAVVITFMVAGMAAYVFYWQGQEGNNLASHKIVAALNKLNSDFSKTQTANRDFANRLAHDNSLIEALAKQDRAQISSILKNAADARGFAGVITTIDENGHVIYSSDTPAKFGYSVRGKNNAVDYVLNNQDTFAGPTSGFTPAQTISLSAMVPVIGSNGQSAGLIAVSEPLDEEYLTGEAMKFALLSEPMPNIDFVLLSLKDRSQIYITPSLLKDRPAYLRALSDQSVRAIPGWQEPGSWQIGNILSWFSNLFNKNSSVTGGMAGFVKDNRFWQPYTLLSSANKSSSNSGTANGADIIAVILATTPIQPQGIKAGFVIIASCIMGLAAIFSIIALGSQLKGEPDAEMNTVMERIRRWRTDKHLPPGKKPAAPWLELTELIDQTFIEWQSNIQGLRVQLNKVAQPKEDQGEHRPVDDAQFEALNRQLANQSRQLSEFSRQLNHANQQAVFLQHELDAVLKSTNEGFLILDQYGNIIHANSTFLGWLGASEAEIAGRFCFDLISSSSANDQTKTKPELAKAFTQREVDPGALINQFFPEGFIQSAQSDKPIEVILHIQPVNAHDNKINGYILSVRDKSMRSEIAGLKTEIITMLARSIRGPLLNADKEWQNVLAAQHELKDQPLADDTSAPRNSMPEEVHEQLNRELNQELKKPELTFAQRLTNLRSRYDNVIKSVENLLTTHGQSIGQMIPIANESGTFPSLDLDSILATAEPAKESFPLTRLIGECLQESSNLANAKQLVLDYKTSTALPDLTSDRGLVKSILLPVIDHMISITESGGKVRVESLLKDGCIELSISSSGPALSEEETADMFAGFIPDKHNEDTYGSRLALYLSRNNAERIGARIWAQSEAEQGTAVYLAFALG